MAIIEKFRDLDGQWMLGGRKISKKKVQYLDRDGDPFNYAFPDQGVMVPDEVGQEQPKVYMPISLRDGEIVPVEDTRIFRNTINGTFLDLNGRLATVSQGGLIEGVSWESVREGIDYKELVYVGQDDPVSSNNCPSAAIWIQPALVDEIIDLEPEIIDPEIVDPQ